MLSSSSKKNEVPIYTFLFKEDTKVLSPGVLSPLPIHLFSKEACIYQNQLSALHHENQELKKEVEEKRAKIKEMEKKNLTNRNKELETKLSKINALVSDELEDNRILAFLKNDNSAEESPEAQSSVSKPNVVDHTEELEKIRKRAKMQRKKLDAAISDKFLPANDFQSIKDISEEIIQHSSKKYELKLELNDLIAASGNQEKIDELKEAIGEYKEKINDLIQKRDDLLKKHNIDFDSSE